MNGRVDTERRQDRLIHEHEHDPYKTKAKPTEPAVCPSCGAVYAGGRWQWLAEHPFGANEQICQACRRIKDHYPAGVVVVDGEFSRRHRDEILNLIRRQEALEKEQHPLHRIMNIEERVNEVVINTTDIHLPRRIGEALRRAYKGELDLDYKEGTYFIRLKWSRMA
jgi:hypothetical protein